VIRASAPGKAVIWGEYAVLAGAPAMVMAVDRYASCCIKPGGDHWSVTALGFEDQIEASVEAIFSDDAPAAGALAPLKAAADVLSITNLPPGASVELDSRAFYASGAPGRKLGIGSSAAICTAACAALAELAECPLSFDGALAAHRQMQRSQGSGVDVAAAYYGGVLRFADGKPTPAAWPAGLSYQFIWTGISATTTEHIQTFSAWRAKGSTRPLEALARSSESLFESADLDRLTNYVTQLKQLDREAGLGIFTEPHKILDRLAIERQLVYKPCGAGGGDIGIVFGQADSSQDQLDSFIKSARKSNFQPLALEIATHGIRPTR
jgi:phosphomevalonate kinase